MKTPIHITLKSCFYKYYWLLVCVLSAFLIAWIILIGPLNSVVIAAIITGLFSFTFFVQKQKLEELKLFSELFSKFNAKYDELNGKLYRIIEERNKPIDENKRHTLYDYFNLCSEEYFYFKKGYIPIEVWEAWCNGMKFYYHFDIIREIWDEELEQNSYYGFSKAILE